MRLWNRDRKNGNGEYALSPEDTPAILANGRQYYSEHHSEAKAKQIEMRIRGWLKSGELDPNALNADNFSLLSQALTHGWEDTAAALLRHGADPHARMTVSRVSEHNELLLQPETTLSYCAAYNTAALGMLLVLAAKTGRLLDLDRLHEGYSPLHRTCVEKCLDAPQSIRLLGRWGANPNLSIATTKKSLLEYTANQNSENFAALLDCGADLGVPHSDGARTVREWIEADPTFGHAYDHLASLRYDWGERLKKQLLAKDWLQTREDGTEIVHPELLAAIGTGMQEALSPDNWRQPLEDIPRIFAALPRHCQHYPIVANARAMVDRQRVQAAAPLTHWESRICGHPGPVGRSC